MDKRYVRAITWPLYAKVTMAGTVSGSNTMMPADYGTCFQREGSSEWYARGCNVYMT